MWQPIHVFITVMMEWLLGLHLKNIKTSNQIKILLQKLGNLRETKDISNVEYFDAVLGAVQGEKKSEIEKLTALVENWESKPEFPSNKTKILLTGSDVTFKEFMEYLDEVGFRVVRDDLSIGERYYATSIPDKDDPIDSIIDYYFNIFLCQLFFF